MKHIKSINEIHLPEKATDSEIKKAISYIEDRFIEFLDSTEIRGVEVNAIKNSDIIYATFKVRNDIEGQKKLILLDGIISKIKRKYPYVMLSDNKIYISIIKELPDYIENSLLSKFNKTVDDTIKICKKFKRTDDHPELFYYGPRKTNILIKYDAYEKQLKVEYSLVDPFANNYMMGHNDMMKILKPILATKLNLEVKSIDTYQSSNFLYHVLEPA